MKKIVGLFTVIICTAILTTSCTNDKTCSCYSYYLGEETFEEVPLPDKYNTCEEMTNYQAVIKSGTICE